MTCDRCERLPAEGAVVDEPENDGALYFGDEVLGRVLCAPCLALTSADGPWHQVERLDADWQWAAAA